MDLHHQFCISLRSLHYPKFLKYSETQNVCCNHSKIWTMSLYHRVMSPKDAEGMANSVDPDQTAPRTAVWSGTALFAQTCLSENLGSLRYMIKFEIHCTYMYEKRDKTKFRFLVWQRQCISLSLKNLKMTALFLTERTIYGSNCLFLKEIKQTKSLWLKKVSKYIVYLLLCIS